MKKLLLAVFFVTMSMPAGAFYAALEAETRLIYSTYIENSVFEILSQVDEISSVEAFQKFTLKLDKDIDEIKFYFEGRFYLMPLETDFEYTVDNAYFQVESGPFVAYLGKQRMKWGTGYTWNPVDLLQPSPDILDPQDDLEGIFAVRAEYSNPFITPSVILSVEPKGYESDFAENFKAAVRLYKLMGEMDVFVSCIYGHNSLQNIGAALSWDAGLFVVNAEYAATRYMDASLSVIRGMGEMGSGEISHSWLAGINRQIGEEMFLNVEYYHNGAGLDNNMFDRFIEGLETEPGGLVY
ncbi:MAG TPA: hypothetical protein ENN55_03620, partial [Firmicutes bacterium]|nr:hypothetical protein [Bacillota bacterium]